MPPKSKYFPVSSANDDMWSVASSIVNRFTYSFSLLMSTRIDNALGYFPAPWELLYLFIGFIIIKSQIDYTLSTISRKQGVLYKPATDCATAWIETNMATLLLILVQWIVATFERWWRMSQNTAIALIVINTPIFLFFIVLCKLEALKGPFGDFGRVANGVSNSVIFSLAFFMSDALVLQLKVTPDPWTWIMGFIVYAGVVGAIAFAFSEWKTESVGTGALLKAALQRNWETLAYIMVFTVSSLFSNILRGWWNASSSLFVGAMFVNGIIMLGIVVLMLIQEHPAFAGAIPTPMIDRVLFAVAVFTAQQITPSSFALEEWNVAWVLIAIALLDFAVVHVIHTAVSKRKSFVVFRRLLEKYFGLWISIVLATGIRLIVAMISALYARESPKLVAVFSSEAIVLILLCALHIFHGERA